MKRDPSHKPGDRFGQWTLTRYLDSGGNGEVWVAENVAGAAAAIKILYRFGGDHYERFVREIKIVRGLDTNRLAVLPILDADVPVDASRANPPWFVMPLATGISAALGGRPVAEKVEAVRQIAATLVTLLEEEGLHHRDLKPSNLYSYEGRFVVGDFGLARRPEDPDLTEPGKAVGPYAYLPSEAFVGDGEPDAERVDVSVLARTLWQLVAETDRPVRGPIVAGGEYTLTKYTSEEYLPQLDGIIASATHETPSSRPTMVGLDCALGDWLAARDTRSELVREIERADANAAAVLRWLVAWVRKEPGFNSFMFRLDNPTAPTDVPGVDERALIEALEELRERHEITADSEMRDHETGLPRYWSHIYPTINGIERVEDRRVLLAQAAPLLRSLLSPPDLISLDRTPNSVTVGDVTLSASEAFFLLRYLADLGLVTFDEQAGGGGGRLLLNVRVTREGKLFLAG